MVSPGFEAVAEEFERNLLERGDIGAAFVAFTDGRPVVDLWGGLADRDLGRPWLRDTLAGIFSGTKGLVATCLLLLIERGALDLEAPVCSYWPAFAAQGKETILVRHLVSHQAGLPGLETPVTVAEATDDVRMARLLAAQKAICPPGTRLYYHALTFGWLCGELVRRVDGRSVGRFFRDEIARPLGLDAWIGLPAEHEGRVARLQPGRGFGTQGRDGYGREGDGVAWSIWSNPPRFSTDPLPANTRLWRSAEVPASNAVASASAVARLYGCLARGGAIGGHRLVSAELLDLARTRIGRGVEPHLEKPMAFGIGFELQTEEKPFGPPPDGFGHSGAGGSMHGAWPHLRTGFSYITNTLRESDADTRSEALLNALHDGLTASGAASPPKGLNEH